MTLWRPAGAHQPSRSEELVQLVQVYDEDALHEPVVEFPVIAEPDSRFPFNFIRSSYEAGELIIFVGSEAGVIRIPPTGPHTGLFLSIEERKRENDVIQLRNSAIDLACRDFRLMPAQDAIVSTYGDTQTWPDIAGELHIWTLSSRAHAVIERFEGEITAIEVGRETIVLGTGRGEIAYYFSSGTSGWTRKTPRAHSTMVTSVGLDERLSLACAGAKNGLILVWDLDSSANVFCTSIDTEVLAVSIHRHEEASLLVAVDEWGMSHSWELKGLEARG